MICRRPSKRQGMNDVRVTYLEMTDAARMRPKACSDRQFRIVEDEVGNWRINREMYQRVGRDFQWQDKLPWSDDRWRSYVEDPGLRTFVAYHGDELAGYFELLNREGEVEIAIFGLVRECIGKGFGGPLLTRALEEAWAMKPTRVWVHTCSLDHPGALANYQARGMEPYRTENQKMTGL